MSTHTKGPWRVSNQDFATGVTNGYDVMCGDPDGSSLLCVAADLRSLADAYLIAAAPDLIAACIDALAQMGGGHKSCGHEFECVCVGDRLMAAIAKARGSR